MTSQPYRHGTAEILGAAHDDHNLSTNNRFSEAQLLEAIAANPQSVAFRLELASWYMLRDKVGKAETVAMSVLAHAPDNQEARFQLTLAQRKMGKISASEAALVFCELVAKGKPVASWFREASEVLLHTGQTEMAIKYANKALLADPMDQQNYLQKVLCLHHIGDYERLAPALTVAMKLGHVSPIFHHFHAHVLESRGQFEAAVEAEKKALMEGERFVYLSSLAGLLMRLGRNHEALDCCHAALPMAGVFKVGVEARIEKIKAQLSEAQGTPPTGKPAPTKDTSLPC